LPKENSQQLLLQQTGQAGILDEDGFVALGASGDAADLDAGALATRLSGVARLFRNVVLPLAREGVRRRGYFRGLNGDAMQFGDGPMPTDFARGRSV
jgi:hypothetical protein